MIAELIQFFAILLVHSYNSLQMTFLLSPPQQVKPAYDVLVPSNTDVHSYLL